MENLTLSELAKNFRELNLKFANKSLQTLCAEYVSEKPNSSISELTDFLFNVKGFEKDSLYSPEKLYFFAKDFLTKN
jgi:hypothetical protein